MLANGRIPAIPTPVPPVRKSRWTRLAGKASEVFASAKGIILWGLLVASAIVVVVAAGLVVRAQDVNAKINQLKAGKDIPIDIASAPPALLEARADFLLTRDLIAEAQPILDQAALRASAAEHVRMLYNMANARVRAALKEIEQGKFDQAIPLVSLAKAEYRTALRLDPGDWNAKYNLDVAMRLVRDLPRQEGEADEEGLKEPAKLWTDLPGVPKGLP